MNTQAKDAVAVAMDWLAQLRDEDGAGPSPGGGEPVIDGVPPASDLGDVPPAAPPPGELRDPAPAASADAWVADAWVAAPLPMSDSLPAAAPSGTSAPGRAGTKANIEITERAAIGDELRMPLAWCEMGSCISHYADPAALGEADNRARAIAAGWRVDALGRLACPQCQQGDCWFWTAHPVALWDRDTAVAMTTLMAAAARHIRSADRAAGVDQGAVPGPRPEMARSPGGGRHRGHPAHPDRAQ